MTVRLRVVPATAPDNIGSDMPEWRQGAVCASTDPELFFPEKGASTRQAKKICSGCEFIAECLEWALTHNEYGIWGGLSETERRGLPGRVSRVNTPAACGTSSGYRAHYRRKESPCQPCRKADSLRRAIARGVA